MKKRSIIKLTTSAVMLALAFALSCVPVWTLPYGGTLTLFSMVPICLVSVKYGMGWGLGTAFCYSWLQILQGKVFTWGLTPGMLAASLILDYVAAYTVLGIAGFMRKKGKSGILIGCIIACVSRFLFHFISGIVLWANYEQFIAFGKEWVNRPVLYSLVYNGAYMLPETILTAAAVAILINLRQIQRFIVPED